MAITIKDTDNNITFEIDIRKTTCAECAYCWYLGPENKQCTKLKDPRNIRGYTTFQNYCQDTLGEHEMPKAGTLETNLPQIFSDESLVELKQPQPQPTPLASINDYCEMMCIMVCVKDCPLYIWRKNKEEI